MDFLAKLAFFVLTLALIPAIGSAQTFRDVTNNTFERGAIQEVVEKGWLRSQTPDTFGYRAPLTPDEWFFLLMFLRTDDACPELGTQPTEHWAPANIRACLAGAGVPTVLEREDTVRRDEAMQQLFALRRRSFAFQRLQTKPADYIEPTDLKTVSVNRQGALVAADRLKLLFRSKGNLLPEAPLLREDAALAVTRFFAWEKQGGQDRETKDIRIVSKEATLNHWRDLDTDIYVLQIRTGGDTILKPILPRRSFNPAKDPTTEKRRDEFIYQPVSDLAKESGALAAINGSYFNVEWPWGALEDTTIVDAKSILERTDRSTFIICTDGKLYIGKYDKKQLHAIKCTPNQALGAGPLFVSHGQILTESTKEGFDEYTQWERRVGKNARTAIGISQDRKTAYLVVVAGKSYPAFGRGGSSLGTFLKEKYPDLHDAMMYDGGGSSALYAQNTLLVGMGMSGSAEERAVISALGVFSKKSSNAREKQFVQEKQKRWDTGTVTIKVPKPTTVFSWQTVKDAKRNGATIQLANMRGSQIQIKSIKGIEKTFHFTFDLFLQDTTSSLLFARREGLHEKGWRIPTELHVIDPKNQSDTDIIKLFAYLPKDQTPDLKTFDVLTTRKTGVVFGDATGRAWFYYAKDKQLSPAKFAEPVKLRTPAKKIKR